MFAPLVVPAISAACVIGNFVIYRIPAARRAMDAEDQGFPGTEYVTAQQALSKATWIALSVALLLAVIGIVVSR
jgi:hypothetical protein